MLGAWHLFCNLTTIGIWRAQLGTNHFHTGDAAGAVQFDAQRLQVEFEINPFLTRVFHFTLGAWHVGFITTVGADNLGGALTDRGAYAVHGGVTTTQHDHTLAFHADIRLVLFWLVAHQLLGVGNQERQRIVHARCFFVLQSPTHRLIGTYAEEHRIVFA
ncbi:hypothetical protein D3C71_1753760 [compost metagenome]